MTIILQATIVLCFVVFYVQCQLEVCQEFCDTKLYEAATISGKRIRLYHKEKNWQEAADMCETFGGHLLNIKNSYENYEMFKFLKHRIWGAGRVHTGFIHTYMWIGGTDKDKEGHYVWKPSNEPFDYTNWSGVENNHYWQQPDDGQGEEDCVELYIYNTKNVFWNDAPCWEKKRFICELPNEFTTELLYLKSKYK